MNSKSGTLLTDNLVPFLNSLPAQAGPLVSKLKDMIATNPQGLYQMLFNADTMKNMPSFLTDKMVPILKTSLMDSLHSVFFVGLGFAVIGAVCTLFIKQIKLSGKKAARKSDEGEKGNIKKVASPSE
jgi:hypothetical protein